MGLESATYINQLNASNPVGSVDNYSTADDHIRLLKQVLKNTFPTIDANVLPSPSEFNYLVGVSSAIQTQLNAKEATANKNANNGYAGLNASAQLLDARLQLSNVTQFQASLVLAATQLTSGIVPDARFPGTLPGISGANLTNLNAANLASGNIPDARVPLTNISQWQGSLSISVAQLTGSMPDARIQASNVTQHQASLSISESQIPDSTILARVGATESITGAWTFNTPPIFNGSQLTGSTRLTGTVSPTVAANQDNWNPGITGCNVLRTTFNSPGLNVTGLIAGDSGQFILFLNIGSNACNLLNESGSSTAANRFATLSAATQTVQGGDSRLLYYDGTSARWRVLN